MTDFDDFIAENKPTGKSPKLDRFRDDILGLKNLGYSERDILRYLSEKKSVTVSRKTLNLFINRHIRASIGLVPVKSVSRQQEQPKNEPVHTLSSQNNSSETVAGKKPFNWEAAKEEDWRDLI